MSKTQVSVFVIIGILLVVVLSIIFISSTNVKKQTFSSDQTTKILNLKADQIEDYVEQCLYDISTITVFNRLGLQGGYVDPNKTGVPWKRSGFVKIPYWYKDGVDYSPSIENVESQFEEFLSVYARNCTDFSSMESLEGIKITHPEELIFEVSINELDVSVLFHYPVVLSIDDTKKTIENFDTRINVAYGNNFKQAKRILQNLTNTDENGFNLRFECNNLNYDGYINVFPINNKLVIYDYKTFLDEKFQRTFTLQFMYDDKLMYGYCSG